MSYQREDFHVGDRVRFRDWDDMANEFGLNCNGSIDVFHSFPEFMKHLCGTTAVISKIDGTSVLLKDFEVDDHDYFYSFDMIEPLFTPLNVDFNADDFLSMLGGEPTC